MNYRSLALVLSVCAAPLTTTHAADRARDYETVRQIALRDPKVKAAYAAADRRLAERIVEIDPTLKGYTPGKPAPKSSAAPTAAAKPAPKPTPVAKSAPPAPKPTVRRDPKAFQRSHVVAKGDTLGGIAAKYNVSTAELRKVNSIADEKRLPVGQVLAIPNSSRKPQASSNPKPAAPRKTAQAKPEEKSWWEQMRTNF